MPYPAVMPRRKAPNPRVSSRNVYVADYLVSGLHRVYAVTSRGELLVLEDDQTDERRHYRDVPAEDVDATVADMHILLDLKDAIGHGVSLPPLLKLLPKSV